MIDSVMARVIRGNVIRSKLSARHCRGCVMTHPSEKLRCNDAAKERGNAGSKGEEGRWKEDENHRQNRTASLRRELHAR